MNLCLLHETDFITDTKIRLFERRFRHLTQIMSVRIGQTIRVGILNGLIGDAKVIQIGSHSIDLEIATPLTIAPPQTLPLTLILALPRPKMLQRSLQTVATMGVETLCLVHTQRVEKSFWQTPLLTEEKINEQLVLGLEQAGATQMPSVQRFTGLNSLFEHMDSLAHNSIKLIAHPGMYPKAASLNNQRAVLAIGPEGGLIDYEVKAFANDGFSIIQLGSRILRVETAIPVTIAKLY